MSDTAIVILFLILAGAFAIATVLAKYYCIQYKLLKRNEEARQMLTEEELEMSKEGGG